MGHMRIMTLLHCILITTCIVNALEPVSTFVFPAFSYFVERLYNNLYGVCDERIIFNASNLEQALAKKLFGQHVASSVVLKGITGHMNNPNPKKPLVLSLHGWSGTGKNFLSQLIAENIYDKGMQSGFVHVFIATEHFPHPDELKTYKTQLKMWVKGNVTKCPRSMFIFDEMDKMQYGLIDTIKPYLDYYENVDGVSYGKAIFIFIRYTNVCAWCNTDTTAWSNLLNMLKSTPSAAKMAYAYYNGRISSTADTSNKGGKKIAEVALDFWRKGRDRQEIQLKDLEKEMAYSVFNSEKGGFGHASFINKNLVDFYVPLLPLEFKHVVQCVLADMASKDIWPDLNAAETMAKDMVYYPEEERIFSSAGCKTITSRLNFYI